MYVKQCSTIARLINTELNEMERETQESTSNEYDYTSWETAMNKVVDMSDWTQMDKTELYFENMEQMILVDAYSYTGPCN